LTAVIPHPTTRKPSCYNAVYLRHGGVHDCRQNDATVTSCALTKIATNGLKKFRRFFRLWEYSTKRRKTRTSCAIIWLGCHSGVEQAFSGVLRSHVHQNSRLVFITKFYVRLYRDSLPMQRRSQASACGVFLSRSKTAQTWVTNNSLRQKVGHA